MFTADKIQNNLTNKTSEFSQAMISILALCVRRLYASKIYTYIIWFSILYLSITTMSFNFTIKIQCYQSRLHAQLIITHTLLNGLILRTHQTASIRVVVWWPPKRITSWFSLCIFVGKQIKFFSDGDGNNFPGCKCRAWQ